MSNKSGQWTDGDKGEAPWFPRRVPSGLHGCIVVQCAYVCRSPEVSGAGGPTLAADDDGLTLALQGPRVAPHLARPLGAVVALEARVAHAPSDHIGVPIGVGEAAVERLAVEGGRGLGQAHAAPVPAALVRAAHAVAARALEALEAAADPCRHASGWTE